MVLQKEPSMKLFAEKFGDAAKLYDVSIREDRYFVSEILSLDSFITQLDEIPLFASQFVMINLATLDVRKPCIISESRESIIDTAHDRHNITPRLSYLLHSSMPSVFTFRLNI